MSANPPFDEQAAAWLCERDEGFAPGRAEAFAAWCAVDPRHVAAVREIEQAMAMLEAMPTVRRPLEARFGPLESMSAAADSQLDREHDSPRARQIGARLFGALVLPTRGRNRLLAAVAATLLLGLGGWWFHALQLAGREHFVNATAAPRQLALRDGSIIHLDAHSELRVDFSGGERRVRLDCGQAHFEVAHDATRPFVVAADGVGVRAIGTAFSVRLAAAAVEVLVEEGRVEVAPAPMAAGGRTFTAPPAPQLGAGERAVLRRDDATAPPQIEKMEPPELREALSWHRRTVVLADVPLGEVVARFNRRNAVQLVLADDELRDRRLGGVLALDQVEAFVALLERGGDVVAERHGPETIVLRRAR